MRSKQRLTIMFLFAMGIFLRGADAAFSEDLIPSAVKASPAFRNIFNISVGPVYTFAVLGLPSGVQTGHAIGLTTNGVFNLGYAIVLEGLLNVIALPWQNPFNMFFAFAIGGGMYSIEGESFLLRTTAGIDFIGQAVGGWLNLGAYVKADAILFFNYRLGLKISVRFVYDFFKPPNQQMLNETADYIIALDVSAGLEFRL
ncbi:MAG: hypothetical protein JXD23_02790 [Spirochaetales bacterium]|nr:hypothetical protein [Spirochaetales bacterium]